MSSTAEPTSTSAAPLNGQREQYVDREQEPLLGRPGDVTQGEESGVAWNLVIGTAPLAQVGALMLAALVWGGVFTHKLLVFSAHPLLNAVAIVAAIEAILVLQPTHTARQKRVGTYIHASLVAFAALAFVGALGIVLWHKKNSHIEHFESPHAILGVIIYALILIQALIGFTQYFVPSVYGGVENAKSIYKYHRISGYLILIMLLANVILATQTFYVGKVLKIKTWPVVVAGVLVVVGVVPRVKLRKMRFW